MYAILRFQKKTGGKLLSTQKHNERQKERYKSNPDIDRERSDENIHLKTPSSGGYKTGGVGTHGEGGMPPS